MSYKPFVLVISILLGLILTSLATAYGNKWRSNPNRNFGNQGPNEVVQLPGQIFVNIRGAQAEPSQYLQIEEVSLEADAKMAQFIRERRGMFQDRIVQVAKTLTYEGAIAPSADRSFRKAVVTRLNEEFGKAAGGEVREILLPKSFIVL